MPAKCVARQLTRLDKPVSGRHVQLHQSSRGSRTANTYVPELVSEILGRVIGTTVLPKGSGELDHVAVTLLLHDALTVTLKLLDTLLVAVEE